MRAGACDVTSECFATKYMTMVVPIKHATMLISGIKRKRTLRSTHARIPKASGAVAVETFIVWSTPSRAAAKTSGRETMVISSRGSTAFM